MVSRVRRREQINCAVTNLTFYCVVIIQARAHAEAFIVDVRTTVLMTNPTISHSYAKPGIVQISLDPPPPPAVKVVNLFITVVGLILYLR